MIAPDALLDALKRRGVGLFVGVPDSLLASFCAYIDDSALPSEHVITANEGNAVAMAVGYHLACGGVAAVYLQNSGLGNTINPLTSLADPEVYRVPMVLIIGWRGEPGVKDEPQHVKQGRITRAQLELLEVPHWVMDASSDVESILEAAFSELRRLNAPVALLVRKGTFSGYTSRRARSQSSTFERESALRELLALTASRDLIVATTGKTSREVFELRVERGEKQRDFLTVGGMGHTASIALGIALGNPRRRVVCLDGDGSVLMHLGALPIIGSLGPANFLHVLLNNAAHESVGGQPTAADRVDFSMLSRASGYAAYELATDIDSLRVCWERLFHRDGPALLEVRIAIGSRADLGRPTNSPEENKQSFMEVARG